MTARNNRFTDPTPFTPLSQLSPEAREWHTKVADAKAREHRGEPGAVQELINLGVYPPDMEEVRARRAAEREARLARDNVADEEVNVELDKTTVDEINKRIGLGQTYARIYREMRLAEMGVDFWTMREYAKAGWLGTKVQITNRLNKLSRENDPAKRAKLVEEVKERVTYLFEGGKALGKTIDRIEKTING
ncbi:MAG: hypothetical protein F4W95_04590 [Chloroflexi bacterium]|nr:hypothetical protein [Chloroflexota bacterium]MYD47750.1 hypothetical protein [Chloroflexota bacterium]